MPLATLTWIDAHRFATSTLRSAAVATNSYVASNYVECFYFDRVGVFVDYTIGSTTSVELRFEISEDATLWREYTSTNTSATTGSVTTSTDAREEYTYVHSGSGTDRIMLDLFDLTELPLITRFFRVSVRVTGTVTNSSITLTAFFSKTASVSELEGLHYAANY